jgi:hypothetical protein
VDTARAFDITAPNRAMANTDADGRVVKSIRAFGVKIAQKHY